MISISPLNAKTYFLTTLEVFLQRFEEGISYVLSVVVRSSLDSNLISE